MSKSKKNKTKCDPGAGAGRVLRDQRHPLQVLIFLEIHYSSLFTATLISLSLLNNLLTTYPTEAITSLQELRVRDDRASIDLVLQFLQAGKTQ